MTLQNRVTPDGRFIPHLARGLFMGNRGGRLHDPVTLTLGTRRHVSRRWICCALSFKDYSRKVWRTGYTELFFLDEVTAFAAGHRPCFECRRREATAFKDAALASQRFVSVEELDAELHLQRLDGRRRRLHRMTSDSLPDGAVILHGGTCHGVVGQALLPWSPDGWGDPAEEPPPGDVDVLTPPLVLEAFRNGYRPVWHPSALNASAKG